MTKVFLIFILILESFQVFGQTDSVDLLIYRNLIYKESLSDTIVYMDSTMGWNEIKELINSKVLKETSPNPKILNLSDNEVVELTKQIGNFENFTVNLYNCTKCIVIPSWDSLDRFHKSNQNLKRALVKDAVDRKDIEAINKLQEFKWVYGFSKPIFFRDNYCIVYRMAILNDAFAGNQSVFIMENDEGKWKKGFQISLGDW